MTTDDFLDVSVTQAIKKHVVKHKQDFISIIYGRYIKMLPSLIGIENSENTAIDVLKLETMLRNDYTCILGENSLGHLSLLGYVIKHDYKELDYTEILYTKDDIKFIVPLQYVPDTMDQITYNDNGVTGNFVPISNHYRGSDNDSKIIAHYIEEMAEIVISRFSLSIQARFLSLIKSDSPNSQSINNMISDIYNGNPFPITSDIEMIFDEMIEQIENTSFASNSAELKREYQNKVSELNSLIGIQSLSVDKSSGVSEDEAKGNKSFTIAMGNIKTSSRDNSLTLLNKRYGTELRAIYLNDVNGTEKGETDVQIYNDDV